MQHQRNPFACLSNGNININSNSSSSSSSNSYSHHHIGKLIGESKTMTNGVQPRVLGERNDGCAASASSRRASMPAGSKRSLTACSQAENRNPKRRRQDSVSSSSSSAAAACHRRSCGVVRPLPLLACDADCPLDLSVTRTPRSPTPLDLSRETLATTTTTTAAAATLPIGPFGLLNPLLLSAVMATHQPVAMATSADSAAAAPPDSPEPVVVATSSPEASQSSGRQPATLCHQCHLGFANQRQLNQHFRCNHLPALLEEFDNAKSWKTTAVDGGELSVEAATVRLESGEAVGFKCPDCDYFAKWPTELQKHCMVHSRARPHVCVVCGSAYKWKWDLGRHFDKTHEAEDMPNPYKKNPTRPTVAEQKQERLEAVEQLDDSVIDVGVEPQQQVTECEVKVNGEQEVKAAAATSSASASVFTCPICGAAARWQSELKSHLVNHSSFKPYRCVHCCYRSKWKWDVVKHLRRCAVRRGAAGDEKRELDNRTAQGMVVYDPPDPQLYTNQAEVMLYSGGSNTSSPGSESAQAACLTSSPPEAAAVAASTSVSTTSPTSPAFS